jgi:hypothetical protein
MDRNYFPLADSFQGPPHGVSLARLVALGKEALLLEPGPERAALHR